ncbi:unnamed protein product [Adineta ricciae]|uniref:Uncharacterized protein n=1 Tax=Adineta ricciae TaxID=249248 RepID=A0A815PTQ8_ADIRI|nr:unnamed protein product [Adineta ricciae]CAF1453414.1 unnamed protein product [Adineta ricciae]
MSQTGFDNERRLSKQTKCQRSSSVYATNRQHCSQEGYKRRSSTFSSGIEQMMEYVHQKLSRSHDQGKQEFDDLKTIK